MSSPGLLLPGGSKITSLKMRVDVLICTALVNHIGVIPSMVGRNEAAMTFLLTLLFIQLCFVCTKPLPLEGGS